MRKALALAILLALGATACSTSASERAVPPQEIPDLTDETWIERTAEDTGIPERALQAYAQAAVALAECGIGWNTLAAIGATESGHGSHGGATIASDGLVTPEVIGIALDGGESVAAVPDTDGGSYDGDTEWDRAVGPMQFIPETWEIYAQDGNGDGEANPHQIDDAALTAATLLCERGGDLTTEEGWYSAILAYNASEQYAAVVADRATRYVE